MLKPLYIFIALILSACAPIPHAAKIKPEIRGNALYKGAPAVGAEIRQCTEFSEGNCTKYNSVVADANGYFKLRARREFRWYVTLLGDEMFGYGFSVLYEGKAYPGCSGFDLGVLRDVTHISYELTSEEECNLNLGQ
jgi:hypothetical protein